MCLHIMESNSLCSSFFDVYVLTSVCVYIRMRFFFFDKRLTPGEKNESAEFPKYSLGGIGW